MLTLEGHQGEVDCLAFSRDGKLLATGGGTKDGSGKLFLSLAGTATNERQTDSKRLDLLHHFENFPARSGSACLGY